MAKNIILALSVYVIVTLVLYVAFYVGNDGKDIWHWSDSRFKFLFLWSAISIGVTLLIASFIEEKK